MLGARFPRRRAGIAFSRCFGVGARLRRRCVVGCRGRRRAGAAGFAARYGWSALSTRAELEIFDAHTRFLGPLAVGMHRHELLVGVQRVGLRGLLPVAVLRELPHAFLGSHAVLTVRMLPQKVLVSLGGIGSLCGLPILPDVTAAGNG